MTAKELIKRLQECPEDAEVRFQVCSRFWTDEYSIDDGPSVEDDIIVLRAFLDDKSFKADVKEKIDKLKGQVEEPYLLFVKTIWMTENKSGFYIFRNVKDNNYELRLFYLAGAYPLLQTFDTIEGAVEYAESIKPKD